MICYLLRISIFQIGREKLVIFPFAGHKFGVCSVLDNLSVVQNVNHICISNGAHAMRNCDGSPSSCGFLKRVLNKRLGL